MTPSGPDQPADFYQVLGVDACAARADIVRAYRQQARTWHPDARPGDPAAEARFRLVTLAYEVLADPGRRAHYDRAHPGAGGTGTRPRRGAAGRPVAVRLLGDAEPGQAGSGRPPLWAGPVRVEPCARPVSAAGPQGPRPPVRPAADLEWRPGGWLW